jgi:hypothetical protein
MVSNEISMIDHDSDTQRCMDINHETARQHDEHKVADGGLRAWTVCFATVFSFGLYLGFDFNYGLIYSTLIKEYNQTENNVVFAGKANQGCNFSNRTILD